MNKSAMPITLEEFERQMYPSDEHSAIKPAFKNEKKAVCLVSSDEYSPFASLVLQGIIDNASPDKNYDIVILTKDMTMRNSYVLSQMADGHENISIRIRNVNSQIENMNFYTWAHFTIDTYLRLLIPGIFKDYDRVLYLDSDVIVNHDVAELMDMDMGDCYIAATYDTHVVAYNNYIENYGDYNRETLAMADPRQYFQMGVALYDVRRMNNDYPSDYLIKEVSKVQLKWLDQDFLNKTFYGRICPISNKWNVMICNTFPVLDESMLSDAQRREYADARRDPYIIHYVGRHAPCFTLQPDLWTFFWKYARRSPYYEIILQKMALSAAQSCVLQQRTEKSPKYMRKKYMFYRLMAHVTFGRAHARYKKKKDKIKSVLDSQK